MSMKRCRMHLREPELRTVVREGTLAVMRQANRVANNPVAIADEALRAALQFYRKYADAVVVEQALADCLTALEAKRDRTT